MDLRLVGSASRCDSPVSYTGEPRGTGGPGQVDAHCHGSLVGISRVLGRQKEAVRTRVGELDPSQGWGSSLVAGSPGLRIGGSRVVSRRKR